MTNAIDAVRTSGPEFVAWLVDNLTDLEFELLIRQRITKLFDALAAKHESLYSGCNVCVYYHGFNDKSEWKVKIGENYSNNVELMGEVLSNTVHNVGMAYRLQSGNKLSLLLPAPESDSDDATLF